MFYVNSSTAGDQLSYECRGDGLTHFTRQLLDHRTARLVSQMKQTDEVYSVNHRRRRSDASNSFSAASDPWETIDPASSSFRSHHYDRFVADDGSGELTHDVMLPADEITEGVGGISDSGVLPSSAEYEGADAVSEMAQPRQTKMIPYARVVSPRHSTSLRTFCLNYYDSQQSVLVLQRVHIFNSVR